MLYLKMGQLTWREKKEGGYRRGSILGGLLAALFLPTLRLSGFGVTKEKMLTQHITTRE